MADVWKIAENTKADKMYSIIKLTSFGSNISAAESLTSMCNQMSNTYDQIIDDQNDYEMEIDAQLEEIETLKKDLEEKIQAQEAEKQKILETAGNDGLTKEDETKIQTIDAEIASLNGDTNSKISAIGSKVEDTSSKEKDNASKAKIATDYGETAIEKGTPLANTKDKRKSFWRKLSGSWNKAATRKAGNDAIDAGSNLLEKVATTSKNEATIIKKTKAVKQ